MVSSPKAELNDTILLRLLETVDRGEGHSQRGLAVEVGIALGLTNAYLRHCVKRGLVKVSEAPARRYAYYLTPRGFAEKSQLTLRFLSNSLVLFRHAKADFGAVFDKAASHGCRTLALAGATDLAEIAALCAMESEIRLAAVVDPSIPRLQLAGLPVVGAFEDLDATVDAIVVTTMTATASTYKTAAGAYGAQRVFVPAFLQASAGLMPVREPGEGGEGA